MFTKFLQRLFIYFYPIFLKIDLMKTKNNSDIFMSSIFSQYPNFYKYTMFQTPKRKTPPHWNSKCLKRSRLVLWCRLRSR